ncbi:MAG: aryl-sulfate sulfotransferase [Promethearchaeota archaeon]
MTLNRNLQLLFLHILLISLLMVSYYSNYLISSPQVDQSHFLHKPSKNSLNSIETNQEEEGVYVKYSGEALDGFNIFQFRNFTAYEYDFRITDMDGNIIKEFLGRNTFSYAHPVNSTTLLLVTSGRMYFWNIETGVNTTVPFTSHHDVSYNPQTKTFMTLKMTLVTSNTGNVYRYDIIEERNMIGDVIWELNTSTFIPFSWWSGEYDMGKRDITHTNSVFWDIEEDMIYINCRNLNTIFKIDHSSGEVVWGLGEFGDFTLFDHKGNIRQNLFYHAHALEKVDENTFILFDNDYFNQTDLTNQNSQLLEITINESTMIAKTSWSWVAPPEYYSAYWGDADRLPNGNRYGVFGSKTHIGTDIGPRFVEVNETGDIIWEMYYKGGSLGVYKAERFILNPIISSPDDRIVGLGERLTLSWQTWYNCRTNLKMNGSFILYQNNEVIQTGDLVFNQFWLPTTLAFDIPDLAVGDYDFVLEVLDEGGHVVTDTIHVQIIPLLVYRNGPSHIELGQDNGIIQWTGPSTPPLDGKIYGNEILLKTFVWDGSNINLDLNTLLPGKYNISFQVFNDSDQLYYSDTFWVYVFYSSPPEIISGPVNMWLWLNQTNVTLMWEVSDLNPSYYEILTNGLLVESAPWNGSDIIFVCEVSEIGKIIVTLLVYDTLGNRIEDIVVIEIRNQTKNSVFIPFISLFLGIGILTIQRMRKR